jgi:hypothetical protein
MSLRIETAAASAAAFTRPSDRAFASSNERLTGKKRTAERISNAVEPALDSLKVSFQAPLPSPPSGRTTPGTPETPTLKDRAAFLFDASTVDASLFNRKAKRARTDSFEKFIDDLEDLVDTGVDRAPARTSLAASSFFTRGVEVGVLPAENFTRANFLDEIVDANEAFEDVLRRAEFKYLPITISSPIDGAYLTTLPPEDRAKFIRPLEPSAATLREEPGEKTFTRLSRLLETRTSSSIRSGRWSKELLSNFIDLLQYRDERGATLTQRQIGLLLDRNHTSISKQLKAHENDEEYKDIIRQYRLDNPKTHKK